MEQFLPFALPDIGEEETREVLECLHSGWLTTGPRTKRFEEEMAAALGEGIHALAVCSATAGLHLALEALGVGPGDEVLVPTYTFTATAEVVRYLGAHPVFVDSDEGSLNMDPLEAEAKTTSRTKAILPVHLGGLPCDMARFFDLASRRGLRIVEDAAHAYTSCWHGRPIGALDSDAAVLSFYATKTLTTGEGGMLLTRDENVARRARVMRLHGISRDAFDRYTSPKASWFYEVVAPGFKYNMMDLVAAIGIHQLRKAPLFRERREQIALRYDDLFRDLPLVLPAMSGTRETAPPGISTSCVFPPMRRCAGTILSSVFRSGVSAPASTTYRCTSSPTGGRPTPCTPRTSPGPKGPTRVP